jgi:hypothetical protein
MLQGLFKNNMDIFCHANGKIRVVFFLKVFGCSCRLAVRG